MGGKTSKSTQAITVPPEVLARYNAVNTRADTVTNRPYQYYTGQFVAPLTATQQSGIANTNAAAGMAQPYYGAATGQLISAQQAASPYYQGATQQLAQGINAGNQFANQSSGSLNNAQNVGNQLAGQSYGAINQAQGVGSDLAGQSYGAINQAQGVGNQFANQSSGTLSNAQNVGNQFAGQSYGAINQAQGVGNELAGQSYGAINQAQGVGNQFANQSSGTLSNAQNVGNQLAAQSYGSLNDAQGIGNQLAAQSYGTLGGAQDVGNQLAGQSYGALGQAQGVGSQLAGQSLNTINTAQNQAAGIQQGALGGLGAAYSGAQPYNQAAGGLYQQGLEQGQNLTGQSSYGTQQALAGAQPYQGAATQYMGAGAQAVNPNELGADQINKYLSPYLSTVLQGTAGLLNQQNQQQQAGQMGNAIRSGAFGGDRSGIAAANLNQQQNLANSKIYSDILNQGFGQALGTAQQQQQLGLGAAQANRAAQQQASQQALAIGQQGFGQGLSAAQQQAALGQQLFGMGSTTGQNAAALGQQIYNQGTGTAQQQAALAQQMFGQGATTAAQQAALSQQQFGQGATAAQQLASLGQQQFGQGATAAQQQAALGQQQFGQGATVAQQQAALGQQQFGQGATAAQQQAALGQQQFGQGATTAQQLASLGQQQFGQGATTSQQLSNLGQQQFGQGATAAQQQAALGQQQFGQGATTSQQLASLGQQQFGQGATTAQQLASLGQQQFGQGATTAAQQAALGQQQFGQGTAASQQAAALGQGIYGMGANTSAQLAGLGAGAQGAALSGAGAQLAAGQAEQATQQAENTAKYNEFLQAQSLPYQQLKLASDIALGTGTASGSTTTTAQPGGFFSDERLKENIKAVGKTFDGQTIHSYNYKGDPRTQIGLIAQEVQKHHPEAVGLAGGYKTVNYDKATEDAADRGHMASGGLASAGGSVMPYNAGQGFADGGLAGFDPAIMQQMLAAQQAMYAPLSSNNMYSGGPNAGGGLVPQTEFAARELMVPAELARQATGAEQANSIANLGKTVGELGGEVGAWDWGGEEAKKKGKTPVPTTAAAASAPAATVAPPPEPVDTTPPTPEELLERQGRALGGGIPYSGQGLDIPDSGISAGSGSPMTASALQAQQSGIQKLGDTADTGMKLFKAGKKLSKLFADGGGVPYGGQGLDIPDEDESSKTYQLPTAGDMPDKPKSGFSKAVKAAGTVAKLAAMFSDKRMKENIKPIGKLFDGQIVHSYNYKGDPRTQIGLIAQEVEGHKPHAVGSAGKYKTVDYAKATSGAAKRGHFAVGGMPEEEMDDVPSYEPTGLYHGDNKFVRNLFKSTASGNKNIDLMSGEEMPAPMGEGAPQESGFAKMPEPVGLAGAAKAGLPELLKAAKPKEFARPKGLAPTIGTLPTGIMQIARLIHAGEGAGQNPKSSALGPYQFIDSTFAGEFRKNYPDRAKGMSDGDIIALKRSPEGAAISEAMGPKLIANNAKIVERAGFEPDAGNVYLAHFLGPDTAVKVLRADPSAPISRYVSEAAIRANPPLQKNPTVGGAINWARGYMQKQADFLDRKQRAFGGLAGRNGYAVNGRVDGKFNIPEDIDALSEVEKLPPEEIVPAPEMRKSEGLAPPAVVMPTEAPSPMPTAPVAEKPMGLGAAAPTAPAAVQPVAEDNNFFRGLKRGKATSIIPLLSGIAAMGTAPTRSLGVALSAGIGAGAQAAQGQRAFGLKQGELGVAQQLANARTMEITRGVLENRYVILSDGMVKDTFTNKYLTPEEALIVRQQAFANDPKQAYGKPSVEGMSREEFEKRYPPPGSNVPKQSVKKAYNPNPNNAEETILAAAEQTPGVELAYDARNQAAAEMKSIERALGEAGLPQAVRTQYNELYQIARNRYLDNNKLWEDALLRVTDASRTALKEGNSALVTTNANALVPLLESARTALATKETISTMLPDIKEGGPLAPLQENIGLRMEQVGFSKEFVKSLIGQDPSSMSVQNALASQLTLAGVDPATLRSGAGTINPADAVRALLKNVDKKADAQISAFNKANANFQSNPLRSNVPGTSIDAEKDSFAKSNAKRYVDHPAKGLLKKGTPYYVGTDQTLHYAK